MTCFFLGFDVGATKSHVLVADNTGRALGFAQGGPGNPMTIGYDSFAELIRALTHEVLVSAGVSKNDVAGAGFGIGGYDWPSQREPILRAIQSLGLDAPIEIVNDAIIALLAGTSDGWGLAVVAGTSCNCWGWDQQRRVGRMTGFSWLGEAAGSHELVNKAIEAIAREWTRRGPPTGLTPAFVELAHARDAAGLIEDLTLGRLQLGAESAPVVFRVAAEGDPVARELVAWAGRELGDLAVGVIRQLHLERRTFEVVLAGSFFNGSPRLAETMREVILGLAPGAHLVRLHVPPVVGGVLLGMEITGLKASPARQTLVESVDRLLTSTIRTRAQRRNHDNKGIS